MTMLAKPHPQPDVIAAHLAAAAVINLSCQPLTEAAKLQPSLEFAAATAYATGGFDLPSETFDTHILKTRAMLAMDESASSSPQHIPIHFLQGSTKLPITSVEDRRRRSLYLHRRYRRSTPPATRQHTFLRPKSPAAYLQQFTARGKSP
jgi:hypothetical protein